MTHLKHPNTLPFSFVDNIWCHFSKAELIHVMVRLSQIIYLALTCERQTITLS